MSACSLRRDQKVLFGFGQSVGQAGERSDQFSAGAGWPAASQDFGRPPGLVGALEADEVVTAHEQRIGIEDLRARRGIVDVVQADQRVAQEGGHEGADIIQFLGICGGMLDESAEVQLSLRLDVLFRPIAET